MAFSAAIARDTAAPPCVAYSKRCFDGNGDGQAWRLVCVRRTPKQGTPKQGRKAHNVDFIRSLFLGRLRVCAHLLWYHGPRALSSHGSEKFSLGVSTACTLYDRHATAACRLVGRGPPAVSNRIPCRTLHCGGLDASTAICTTAANLQLTMGAAFSCCATVCRAEEQTGAQL